MLIRRPCAQAVENLLLTREAIRSVASKHGKAATFLPKLSQHDCGNGAHLHWSMQTVRSLPGDTMQARNARSRDHSSDV